MPDMTNANSSKTLCLYVDVDGTLIHSQGANPRTNGELVSKIKKWKSEGALLYCWSSRGAGYAQRVARRLGIEDCFSAFLCKPHILIDDQAVNDWSCLVHLYPLQIGNHTVDSLTRMIDDEI